ncbi:MAG: DUF1467 family protein [Rhodospirillaceae bacterium]|jgi:predicted secreted protein
MTLTSGIVVYVIVWWLVFFMMLPIGVRPPHELGKNAETGHEPGAPVAPRLWIKTLASTVIAGLIWLILLWVINSDVISLRPV